MKLNIIYEDEDILVIDKPAGIVVFPENEITERTLIDYLLEKLPDLKKVDRAPRYGIVHRLDKDTSGILLVAKKNRALSFFQKQFKTGKVVKRYLTLVVGNLKNNEGGIETLIGRSPKDKRRQKVYLPLTPEAKRKRLRRAITEYKVLKRFKNFTLIEAVPKTGRKHQIRVHLAYLGYPIAGDKLYGFKNQISPEGLKRQFLHTNYLKIGFPSGELKEFYSELPEDLRKVLENLKSKCQNPNVKSMSNG